MTSRLPGFRRVAATAAVVLMLAEVAACTTNPATGRQTFTSFMGPEEEKRVGAEEHPKILKEFGGAYEEDPALNRYVQQVGEKLARTSEMPNLEFRFTVLNNDQVNAFALPGGYVYITRGLLSAAENEAEMAGVLAHEIGHVTARHTAERYSQAVAANIGLSIIGIVGSIYGAPAEIGQVLSTGAEAVLKGWSRDQEMESDMLGVRYLARAGYDTGAMVSFFRKLQGHDELRAAMTGTPTGEEAYNFRSTHPRTTDRIRQAIQLSNATMVANPTLGRNAYLERIDGMIFGDDPSQGVRRGREFLHPDLRFRFEVPPDFVMLNSPERVLARHRNGSIILFDMAPEERAKRARDLRSYLVDDWGAKFSLKDVERLTINGLEAWTGWATASTRSGPRDVRLVVIGGDPAQIFRFAFLTPRDLTSQMETGLQRTTYSFRRLSAAEAAGIKPLRIRVVTVAEGDTLTDFARRMDTGKFAREWFELLNAGVVEPGRALQPGTRVKIVR